MYTEVTTFNLLCKHDLFKRANYVSRSFQPLFQ